MIIMVLFGYLFFGLQTNKIWEPQKNYKWKVILGWPYYIGLIKSRNEYSDFYEKANERQKVLDAFVDHGICSIKYGCKSVKVYNKCLPPEDIKYIYERINQLISGIQTKEQIK